MHDRYSRPLLAALAAAATLATPAAFAAKPPPDPCSLLPAAEVSHVLGRPFGPPASSVAPRPYRNTAQGTDCLYQASHGSLLFRVYFDESAAQSADLFKRLEMFFGSGTPVPGVGDDTYIDRQHALHERKGNVRFYLRLDGVHETGSAKEKVLVDLAKGIGGRL